MKIRKDFFVDFDKVDLQKMTNEEAQKSLGKCENPTCCKAFVVKDFKDTDCDKDTRKIILNIYCNEKSLGRSEVLATIYCSEEEHKNICMMYHALEENNLTHCMIEVLYSHGLVFAII